MPLGYKVLHVWPDCINIRDEKIGIRDHMKIIDDLDQSTKQEMH